jgi:hypothetical protein
MRVTKNRAMEYMCGLMVEGMRDSGRVVNNMAREDIQGLMGRLEKENGRRGKG